MSSRLVAATSVGAGGAEDALAGDRALLLAHEAGHAGDDEAEEDDRGDDDHDQVVAVVDDLGRSAMTGAISEATVSSDEPAAASGAASRSGAGVSSSRIDGCSAAAPHSR